MALGAGGPTGPLYIMPIVFGCAPVVSTFTSMYMNNTYKNMSPFFAAGLILVAAGAITILITAPRPKPHASGVHSSKAEPPQAAEATPEPENDVKEWSKP